jgi:tRNA threonylcarbamoyladenosine biosynthesis protein TsaB
VSGTRQKSSVSKKKSALILSLETATRAGSIALTSGARPLASWTGDEQTSHSVSLLHQIEAILKEAGVVLRDVELFAAAMGPGSFTGLRIGLATIKSFAATLARPCLGVPTLHAVAHAAGVSSRTMALLPAGRGELFAQLLAVDEDGAVINLGEATHLAPQRLLEITKEIKSLRWAGEGAHLYREAIKDFARQHAITFLDEGREGRLGHTPPDDEGIWGLAPRAGVLAESVAALAAKRFDAGETERAEELRAIYVRPSDAELKEECLEPSKPTLR